MKILLMGATSKVGQVLLRQVSRIRSRELKLIPASSEIRYGVPIPETQLRHVDAVINFSLDRTGSLENQINKNSSGSTIWAKQCQEMDLKPFIQISTDAVRFNPNSMYAKVKSETERQVSQLPNVKIVRLPTLIGKESVSPFKDLARILNLQSSILQRLIVPKGFSSTKVLKFLNIEELVKVILDSLETSDNTFTPISHLESELFTLCEVWAKHEEIVSGKFIEISRITTFSLSKKQIQSMDFLSKSGLLRQDFLESFKPFI